MWLLFSQESEKRDWGSEEVLCTYEWREVVIDWALIHLAAGMDDYDL